MRRVLVIGSGGAGKSTFAQGLAARTGLPMIHLDARYWWIWGYPARQRPGILRRLSTLSAGQRAVVLRSTADADRFLAAAEDVQKHRGT